MMTESQQLTLTITIPGDTAELDRPFPIIATLINHSSHGVVVNGRMAVGYRDHLARELFAELRDLVSLESALIHETDYDRDFSTAEDYLSLGSGEQISAYFDLFEWYRPEKQGDYQLIVYYQADEPLAEAPPEVLRGVIKSEPVAISIRAGGAGIAGFSDVSPAEHQEEGQ